MNTNKFQRQGYKDTVKEFGKFGEVYGAHVILNLLDDIDTLESENARLREAVKVMKEALEPDEIEGNIWANESQGGKFNEGATFVLKQIAEENKFVLSQVDALLKSEDKE